MSEIQYDLLKSNSLDLFSQPLQNLKINRSSYSTPYNFKVRSMLVDAKYWAFLPKRTPVARAV